MFQSSRIHLMTLASALLLVAVVAGCMPLQPPASWTPVPTVAATVPSAAPTATSGVTPPAATAAPTALPPSATPLPPTPTRVAPTAAPMASTAVLTATLTAQLPKGAFEGITVAPLRPAGAQPLWIVYSYGMRNWDLKPPVDHFVAVYTQVGGAWRELARQSFSYDDRQVAAPDYVYERGIVQAEIEPSRIWLEASGGSGAHGGTYNLLTFDGSALKVELQYASVSPGSGRLLDVNGDGALDVVLDASDRYVFCYACGVTRVIYSVYTWDAANRRLAERNIEPMLMGQSGHPARALTNEAAALAEAGLWKDAMAVIAQARQAAVGVKPPLSNATVDWDYGIIKLHAEAQARWANESSFPLLNNVFYGDYAAAVAPMRAYTPAQIFRSDSPLIVGTPAETFLMALTESITTSVKSALTMRPNLAEAYFLRGWANFLAGAAPATVKADLDRAVSLAPADTLFVASARLFAGATPVPPTPAANGRVQFASGATSGLVEGRLAAGEMGAWLLRALADQWMMVSVFSPKGDVVLEISGVTDGVPLVRSQMRQTSWQGRLRATQDYRIAVLATGGATTYTISVTIPERISFAPGAISYKADGNVAANQVHDYILRAGKGQTMSVALRSPRSDVLLTIYGVDDGQPLVRSVSGATTWTGVLPGTQDYIVKAVAVGPATGYQIEVTIK